MTERKSRLTARPARTSLYREATWLALALRWVFLAGGAIWLYPDYGFRAVAVWILVGVGLYNVIFTALRWSKLHPPLWVAGLFDLAAVTALVIVRGVSTTQVIFVYAFLILILALAYGWKGAAFSLTGYLLGEYVVLLAGTAGWPGDWSMTVRIGSIALGAAILGTLVERYEKLQLRLARVAVDHPKAGVHDLQEFTNALEYLHKLAVRGKWPYSIMVIDIAQPGVQPSYRDAGIDEALLRQLACEARTALRSTDIVGRLGADVFAIALPDTPRPGAEHVACRVEAHLREMESRLDYVVGLAELLPSRKNTYDECLHAAFASVRQVKATRRHYRHGP